MAVLEQLENDFNEKISNKLSYLIKNPDIIKKSESEIDENEYSEFIMPVLEKALIEISAVRDREGGKLVYNRKNCTFKRKSNENKRAERTCCGELHS